MSHFSCVVVTDTRPSEDELQEILLPWHEYECTGIERYLEWEDHTDEIQKAWENDTDGRYRGPDGKLYSGYEWGIFYRPPTFAERQKIGHMGGMGFCQGISYASQHEDGRYVTKVRYVPDGYTECQVPLRELYASPAEYGEESEGYKTDEQGRIGRWTNPNARWDWWQIGGRWSGAFKAGYEPEDDDRNRQRCELCGGTGWRRDTIARRHNPEGSECNGCAGTGVETKWPTQWVNEGNQVQMQYLDLEALRAAEIADRRKRLVRACEKRGLSLKHAKAAWPVWCQAMTTLRERYALAGKPGAFAAWIDEQRDAGMDQAKFVRDQHKLGDALGDWGLGVEEDELDVDAWVQGAPALSAYAMVKDGQWFERGKMGMFACAEGEATLAQWRQEFSRHLATVRPEQWLTMVDCHI